MHTNVERIASLLNITIEVAVYYYRQVLEQLNDSVPTYMVRRSINLYLNRYPGKKPSPCDIADYFYELHDRFWGYVEQDEADHMDSDWLTEKEWDDLPWPEEERHIMHIATYGYAFGKEPEDNSWEDTCEDPWEMKQQSKEHDLAYEWHVKRSDKQYEESAYLDDENDRRIQVQEVCKRHSVTSLFHFTRRDNLAGILQRGILSRRTLEGHSIENAIINDQDRLDNYPNASCLSISFPNYKMFYKYRTQTQSEWVVLELHASILWKLDCAFCHTNAAAAEVRKIPLEQRKGVTALEQLFNDPLIGLPQAKVPPNYTTNPQAEVLVFDPIPTRYLKAIHFQDKTSLQPWEKGDTRLFWCKFVSNKTYFEPRMDYKQWQSA